MLGEYDGHPQDDLGRNNLLRKHIYGPGIDQPVSMIEAGDNNATNYYYFDAPFDYSQGRLWAPT